MPPFKQLLSPRSWRPKGARSIPAFVLSAPDCHALARHFVAVRMMNQSRIPLHAHRLTPWPTSRRIRLTRGPGISSKWGMTWTLGHSPNARMPAGKASEIGPLHHGPSAASGQETATGDHISTGLPDLAIPQGFGQVAGFAAGEVDKVGAPNAGCQLGIVGALAVYYGYRLCACAQTSKVVTPRCIQP